jgi:hypothetical protein
MTSQLTPYIICTFAVLLTLYDVWAVWRGGGKMTISWTMLSWWAVHPFVMSGVWILLGHMFFPQCGPEPGWHASLTPIIGTVVGIIASTLMIYEVCVRWTRECDPNIKLTHWYLLRQIALAAACMAVGHFVFTQYVECV